MTESEPICCQTCWMWKELSGSEGICRMAKDGRGTVTWARFGRYCGAWTSRRMAQVNGEYIPNTFADSLEAFDA